MTNENFKKERVSQLSYQGRTEKLEKGGGAKTKELADSHEKVRIAFEE